MSETNGAPRNIPGRTRHQAVLSTYEVARLLSVAPTTVACWVDSGALAGYRLPHARKPRGVVRNEYFIRRVTRAALRHFMIEYRIPLDLLDGAVPHVLLASADAGLAGGLALALAGHGAEIAVAESWVRLGARQAYGPWDVTVVDFALGTPAQGLDALGELAGWSPRPRVLALLTRDEVAVVEVADEGATALRRPVGADVVSEAVARLLGLGEGEK